MIHLTEWGGFFQTNIMKNNNKDNKDNKDKDSTTTQPTSITQSKCVIHFSSTTQTVDLTKQSSAFIPSLRRVICFLGQLLVTDPQVDNFPIWWLSEGIPLPISGDVLSIFNWSLVKELFPNFTKPKTKSLISRSGIVEIVLPCFAHVFGWQKMLTYSQSTDTVHRFSEGNEVIMSFWSGK